jgi:hypothetical protein
MQVRPINGEQTVAIDSGVSKEEKDQVGKRKGRHRRGTYSMNISGGRGWLGEGGGTLLGKIAFVTKYGIPFARERKINTRKLPASYLS